MGGVGDGGAAAFVAELEARDAGGRLAARDELDERGVQAGTATRRRTLQESVRLVWPAYFADPRVGAAACHESGLRRLPYAETMASAVAELPRPRDGLGHISVPMRVRRRRRQPDPDDLLQRHRRPDPGCVGHVVDGAGHFVWHERPARCSTRSDAWWATG